MIMSVCGGVNGSDDDIVSIPDIVDEIKFLNKASGANTEVPRVRLENPVLGLSNLVNKIAAPEFKNSAAVSTERGIPTSSGKAKRKTVAQVHSAGVATSKQSAVNEPRAIDSCLNWNQELFDSWDACVFTPVPGDSLPSNQEAFGREATVIDNNRDSAEVIRTGFKAIEDRIAGFEKTFASITERLDIIKMLILLYNQSVVETSQNHTITHKQIIATRKLLAGEICRVDHSQHLTTELLKQLVQLV
ncbi:uncharacterized protein LOC128604861 isoform X4 [Ictalurus furcatus]|uniref:uncharacterized protein LOC128604861 isoform X4 n=1 Tax=Ictalurus furcatus TaxID=66913 RepID=UPI00234FC360|nr:uncharacterized protein LOC128604861 isoform X4 [Ictalurus furcatus]